MAHDQERELQLHFGGKPTDGHVVPAAVLTQALQSLQRAVHLLGIRHEGKDVRQRLRVSAEIEMRYAVMCKLPKDGSYISPISIGDTSQTLFDGSAVEAVTGELLDILEAVKAEDAVKVRALLPDPVFRGPILSSLAKMAPPKRTGIEIDLQTPSGQSLFAPAKACNFIERVIEQRPAVPDATVTAVTGRLIGIDFAERTLRLLYPPTKRELKCSYHESVENMLLENPREYVQVVGEVIVDKEGEPERIIDVERILEVDLSPITLSTFYSGNVQVRALSAISFAVSLDESVQYHCIEGGAFGIELIAGTREDLERDLYDELDVLWRQYALEPDDTLSDEAKELKASLLATFEVVR